MNQQTILVIEDDDDISLLLQHIFHDHKIASFYANSIQEAEEALTWLRPTHIFLDVFLPDGNGIDWIKSKENNLNSIVTLMTGNIEEVEIESENFPIIKKPFLAKSILNSLHFRRELT